MISSYGVNVRRTVLLVFFLGCIHLPLAASGAQSPKIDAKADRVLRDLSDYYAALKTFTVDATVSLEIEAEGLKQEMGMESTISMQRPNKCSNVLKSGTFGGTVVYDGKNTYTYVPTLKAYLVEEGPKDLDSFLAKMGKTGEGDSDVPADQFFLSSNPRSFLMQKGLLELDYLGVDEIDQTQCHRLKLTWPGSSWNMWVDAGERPLVRRIIPDVSEMLAEGGEPIPGLSDTKDLRADMVMRFENWEINPDLPADHFTFTPPPGAEKVTPSNAAQKPAKSHPLVGKRAPDFALPMLEGGSFSLSEQRGKNIVILDFWATWCPPCREAMPALAEVAEKYKEKNVILIAVNQGEPPATVRRYISKEKITTPVVLDSTQKAGNRYRARSIPQTVIVGKDGIVQSVHVGYAPSLKRTLTRELDALLSGKTLVPGSGGKARVEEPGASPSAVPVAARLSQVEADMEALASALEMFSIEHGGYPLASEGRTIDQAGIKRGDGQSAEVMRLTSPMKFIERIPVDPFNPDGKAYRYWSDGSSYLLVSDGPDQKADYDERQYKGESLADLRDSLYDPARGENSPGDILRIGP